MKKTIFLWIGIGIGIILFAIGMFFLTIKIFGSNRTYIKKTLFLPNGEKYHFWLYEPENKKLTKMPLLIYFPGAGSRSSLDSVNYYAYPSFINNGMDFPFYMIAPFVNRSDDFDTSSRINKTKILIDYIVKNYPIDKNRIIVSGGSAGARGAYAMASTYKDLFSCMIIGSGVVNGLDDANLTHLPIWFLHGKKDNIIPYYSIQKHVDNINLLGGNAKITVYPNFGHEVTETAFCEQEVIDWMISQTK